MTTVRLTSVALDIVGLNMVRLLTDSLTWTLDYPQSHQLQEDSPMEYNQADYLD